jgi:hypothetical protein
MAKISGKINLAMLTGAVRTMKGRDGDVECFVMPIEQNNLFKGEKGIYLDIIAFEIDPSKRHEDSKDTHLVKQSFSKKDRGLMSEEEIKSKPIIGNLQVWGNYEQEPVADLEAKPEDEDDLPF